MNEREIFQAALDFAEADQRQAFIAQTCGADAALRMRVEKLLASHSAASQFLNQPAVAGDSTFPTLMKSAGQDPESANGSDDELSSTPDISFLQPSTNPRSIGKLGHYEVLEILGHGAFGIVFRAFDEKLHRVVAIKAMNPQLAATSPPRKRFLREARSVAAVRHENIVQIHSVEEQPLPYLVMEFIDGKTLQQKLDENGPLDIIETLHIGRQMACGLAAAHDQGLIHRDIKPANILLEKGPEQKVKITDFGLARAADDASMTRTGVIAGTPTYMAPEQALGQPLDHRADLFSLGSVLYQMVCGRVPFRGPNVISVLKRLVDEAPRPISEILTGVPDWLSAIISKLHAKNPNDRFQSARELAEILARCQSELHSKGTVSVSELAQATCAAERSLSPGVPANSLKPSESKASILPTMRRFALVAIGVIVLSIAVTEMTGVTELFRKNTPSVLQSPPADAPPLVTSPPLAIAPFDAAQAKKHQEEWAAYLKLPIEYTNSIGMKLMLIPPGEFLMGSSDEDIKLALKIAEETKLDANAVKRIQEERPQHAVRITMPFRMGAHEVTVGQFAKFVDQAKYKTQAEDFGGDSSTVRPEEVKADSMKLNWRTPGHPVTDDSPVTQVSWYDAVTFCNWLSDQEKLEPCYQRNGDTWTLLSKANGYRLPTEAEWEYACRAGTTTQYSFGDDWKEFDKHGWSNKKSDGRPQSVGFLSANPFGLNDMHGNVWEWCHDYYGGKWYETSPTNDPVGPNSSTTRAHRGGCWSFNPASGRSSSRYSHASSDRNHIRGFRVLSGVVVARSSP